MGSDPRKSIDMVRHYCVLSKGMNRMIPNRRKRLKLMVRIRGSCQRKSDHIYFRRWSRKMTSVADNQLTSMQPSFGIIFHWGVYSVPAYDDPTSAARRKIQNGSEWYAKRLSETGAFRPVTGWKETQEHHKKLYGAASYEDFASKFTACAWNPIIG